MTEVTHKVHVRTERLLFFSFFLISLGSFLKAPGNYVPVVLRFLTPKRSVKGEFFKKRIHKLLTCSFRELEVPHRSYRGMHKPVIYDFCTFEEMRGVKKKKKEAEEEEEREWKGERRSRRLTERTESRETAGMPDQMGMWEGAACFAPVQRWGRTKRVVHQIFIRASVHSLELHYETKAAENILEEQLNKMWLYL